MTIVLTPKTNGPMMHQIGSLCPLYWPQRPMVLWWTKLVLYDHCTDPKDQWSYVEPIWFFVTIVNALMTNGSMMDQISSLWPLYWSQRPTVLCWTKLVLYDHYTDPKDQWFNVQFNWTDQHTDGQVLTDRFHFRKWVVNFNSWPQVKSYPPTSIALALSN